MKVPHAGWDFASSPLDQLALKTGTDKSSRSHGYTRYYERLLESRRETTRTLLEIGVGGGHSLKLWEGYFPCAAIVGIDIAPEKIGHAGGRRDVIICDAGDPAALSSACAHLEPDIIIDDGSHREADVLTALDVLWPLLAPDGLYFIEDLGVAIYDDRAVNTPEEATARMSTTKEKFVQRLLQFPLQRQANLRIFPSQNQHQAGGQCLCVLEKKC